MCVSVCVRVRVWSEHGQMGACVRIYIYAHLTSYNLNHRININALKCILYTKLRIESCCASEGSLLSSAVAMRLVEGSWASMSGLDLGFRV